MRKIRKEEGAVGGLQMYATHIAVKNVTILAGLAWFGAPAIQQCLDARYFEDGNELCR
jgi:hypothetical protein